MKLHWREFEGWFNHIAWPAYKTYNYSRHHQTVRRWWARCTEKDMERTRQAIENVKLEGAQESQNALPAIDDTPGGTNVVAIDKILGGKGGTE
jgi:hypothetical protein